MQFKIWLENLLPNDLKHTIGNPLFAIETNLNPLRKRIKDGRVEEALQIVAEIEVSLNKAKEALIRNT